MAVSSGYPVTSGFSCLETSGSPWLPAASLLSVELSTCTWPWWQLRVANATHEGSHPHPQGCCGTFASPPVTAGREGSVVGAAGADLSDQEERPFIDKGDSNDLDREGRPLCSDGFQVAGTQLLHPHMTKRLCTGRLSTFWPYRVEGFFLPLFS